MLEIKKCTKCGETKPLTDFYLQKKMSDGRLSKCKTCTKRDVKENRIKKADYYREFEAKRAMLPKRVEMRAKYQSTPDGKAAVIRARRKYVKENPVKRAAHILVGHAVRDGRLTRQPCEVCGKDRAQAHHDDYAKPLDVRWLCTTHHREWHKYNTPLCPDQGE